MLYYSEKLGYPREFFHVPEISFDVTFNGGDTRVPPISLATSPIPPPFSPAS